MVLNTKTEIKYFQRNSKFFEELQTFSQKGDFREILHEIFHIL